VLPENHEALEDRAFADCAALGATLKVSNEGHHWRIVLANRRVVEWWPSSGRLVVDGDWARATFTGDVSEVMSAVVLAGK